MDYLNRILGIQVVYQKESVRSLPNFICARYQVQSVLLDGRGAVFLYPKTEPESINVVKKHFERIKKSEKVPVVLIAQHLTYRQRSYLLKEHLPFIVEDKQIYLPFMAVYLQERCDGEITTAEQLLPSAQMLLLYYMYHGCGELQLNDAAKELRLTAMSVSRASRQLEELGLIQREKRGIQKVLISEKTPEELFAMAKDKLSNPVKRTIYVPKSEIGKTLLHSGYSALSDYTMLNPSTVDYYAATSIAKWEKQATKTLQNAEEQCAVELWRYNPEILSDGDCVDRISLALALRNDHDERIEESVDEMLADLWRNNNGNGNRQL